MLTLVGPDTVPEPDSPPPWRERAVSEEWCFRGRDELGRAGWFLRVEVTGLYARRVGPFPTRGEALDRLEELLAAIVTDPLCELQNDMAHGRRYVIEGIPTLTGQTKGR